jgi:hypothetical protein
METLLIYVAILIFFAHAQTNCPPVVWIIPGLLRAISAEALGTRLSSAPPPNHLVPVFSCEKALNIKKIKVKIKIKIKIKIK